MNAQDTLASPEILISMVALLVSAASFGVSYWMSHSFKRRDLTIEIWKMWVSVDYRRFRVSASRKIKGKLEHQAVPSGTQSYSALADKEDDELAIASVQHIITDMARVYKLKLVDKELFDTLFRSTIEDWQATFNCLEYDFPQSKNIEQDLKDSFNTLLDNRGVDE